MSSTLSRIRASRAARASGVVVSISVMGHLRAFGRAWRSWARRGGRGGRGGGGRGGGGRRPRARGRGGGGGGARRRRGRGGRGGGRAAGDGAVRRAETRPSGHAPDTIDSRPSQYGARSSRLRSLPAPDFGSGSSRSSMRLGTL